MLYLSELVGQPISSAEGAGIGRIRDVVVTLPAPETAATLPTNPLFHGLLTRPQRRGPWLLVPAEEVESLGPRGAVLKPAAPGDNSFQRGERELLLTKDLWDRRV